MSELIKSTNNQWFTSWSNNNHSLIAWTSFLGLFLIFKKGCQHRITVTKTGQSVTFHCLDYLLLTLGKNYDSDWWITKKQSLFYFNALPSYSSTSPVRILVEKEMAAEYFKNCSYTKSQFSLTWQKLILQKC